MRLLKQRGISVNTVEGHVARLIEEGEAIDSRSFVSEVEEEELRKLIDQHGSTPLKPIFDASGEKFSYGQIKIVVALMAAA